MSDSTAIFAAWNEKYVTGSKTKSSRYTAVHNRRGIEPKQNGTQTEVARKAYFAYENEGSQSGHEANEILNRI